MRGLDPIDGGACICRSRDSHQHQHFPLRSHRRGMHSIEHGASVSSRTAGVFAAAIAFPLSPRSDNENSACRGGQAQRAQPCTFAQCRHACVRVLECGLHAVLSATARVLGLEHGVSVQGQVADACPARTALAWTVTSLGLASTCRPQREFPDCCRLHSVVMPA